MNDSKTSNDSGKSKQKKKVSFPIFEISTFDELAKLRKLREEELDDFVSKKKKMNQYLTNLNQRNKILSMSNNELLSFDNNDTNKNSTKQKINIPKPVKKDEIPGNESSYFNTQENFAEHDPLKKKMILSKKNKKNVVFSSDEEDIKSNDLYPSPVQFNSVDYNVNNNNINEGDKDNNEIKENIESNENNENDQNDNIMTFNANNINNTKETNNELNNESHKDIKEEEIKKNEVNVEANVATLVGVLEKIFKISTMDKINLIEQFFSKFVNFIDYKYDEYINYETTDTQYYEEAENKIRKINLKTNYISFINNVRERIEKRKLYKEHIVKAKKYAKYINYKYKVYAFNNLLNFGIKQKAWIRSIRAGLQRKTLWGCLDSLKLYANYKKIKNYLKMRKKKKIFDVLKTNKQLSIQLLKNGRKLSLIFEYRHFFNNCRKKILGRKGKEINNKLVSEFRYQYLLKGIFNLIKRNHDIRKRKKNEYNNRIINKNRRGKDFINIKVTQKETIKYNNGTSLMRIIQNKINA